MNTVILEGPDGSGKTTLADRLRDKGYKKIHFGVPTRDQLRTELNMFNFYFNGIRAEVKNGYSLVVDRCHLSEPIYGPIMRGGTKMTPRVEALLERYLEAIDAQIVICLPSYRTCFNNWVARKGQEYVDSVGNFRKIYEAYHRLLFNPKRNRNFIWYDYTRHQAPSMANALIDLHGNQLPFFAVGSQHPRFMFVGERPGHSDIEDHNYAFLTPAGSSGWLFDCLTEAGYQERDVAFCNVYLRDGTLNPLLHEYLYDLTQQGLQQVIALGKVADQQLTEALVPHVAVEHPQHAKRFKSSQRARYVYALEEIRRNTK